VLRDAADNIVIFKPASAGYESAAPVILQGHLDMVCQKDEDCTIDFEKDGLSLYIDGDFVKARGTTLGADNGIAVAMVLSILESDTIKHPPIEAVFTTDEEIGMIGAMKMDMSVLTAKRLINLDSEEDDTVTVSCAGGSELHATLPCDRVSVSGTDITVTVKGLKGGHSGVEIHKGRVNADKLMGRVLHALRSQAAFSLVGIDGGDKGNAIPKSCTAKLCATDVNAVVNAVKVILADVQKSLASREAGLVFEVTVGERGDRSVFSEAAKNDIIDILVTVPDGVQQMSADIAGLVETSLNLGVLQTHDDVVTMHFALRSNKRDEMAYLEEQLSVLLRRFPCTLDTFGYYPPWEYKADSTLRPLYVRCYEEAHGVSPKVEAIHAGLECGVFAKGITNLDCIAIGPTLADVHTTDERMSIASVKRTYDLLLSILEACR